MLNVKVMLIGSRDICEIEGTRGGIVSRMM